MSNHKIAFFSTLEEWYPKIYYLWLKWFVERCSRTRSLILASLKNDGFQYLLCMKDMHHLCHKLIFTIFYNCFCFIIITQVTLGDFIRKLDQPFWFGNLLQMWVHERKTFVIIHLLIWCYLIYRVLKNALRWMLKFYSTSYWFWF